MNEGGSNRGTGTGALGLAALGVIALVCVAWPAGSVVYSVFAAIFRGEPVSGAAGSLEPALTIAPAWGLLGSTLGWAVGIGIGATVLAWPAAWVIRRHGWGVMAVLGVPLILPTYLTYSGYSTLRAPGSWLFDWTERLVAAGHQNAPMIVGRVVAGAGLVLWAWPIAAVVLGASVRRVDQQVLDALQLDVGPVRRAWEIVKLSRWGLAGSVGAVALVMMGSAVPLHLAQVPTYAIKVWLDLSLSPRSWRVWLGAWPLIVVALGAGWVLGRGVVRAALSPEESALAGGKKVIGCWVLAALVWGCSVLLPWWLFVRTVRNPDRYREFWTLGHNAVWNSLEVAGLVALAGVVICGAVWQGLSARRRTGGGGVIGWVVGVFLVAGLMPGVLVGAAVATATNVTPGTYDLADSIWVLVIGHIARFGFVPALVGCWLASVEPRQERELRTLDDALGWRGWARVSLPVQGGALVGAALAAGALSLHEIEASVVIQPAGVPSLAQTMLNYLHQLKMQDVSAAAALVVGGGLIVAGIAGIGVWTTARRVGRRGS